MALAGLATFSVHPQLDGSNLQLKLILSYLTSWSEPSKSMWRNTMFPKRKYQSIYGLLVKKLVLDPVMLNQNKPSFFHRIHNLCKAQAFDSVAESLSIGGVWRFVTWFRMVKNTRQNVPVDHREIVSVIAIDCVSECLLCLHWHV